MLSIGEFSFLCQLSPQTLRFYHSEGLLVPAHVDASTGYRSYTFDQVEQAMLITVLREAGLSVKLVRRAIDEPATAPTLLQQHVTEVKRQRQIQDEAINAAREFLTSKPEVQERRTPGATVVSTLVPGASEARDHYDWAEADAAFHTTVQGVEPDRGIARSHRVRDPLADVGQ